MFTSLNKKHKLKPHDLQEYNCWEKVSLDLFGPMPNEKSILVAQDMVSKFPTAKILKKTNADHVIEALEEFYNAYGTPIVNRTDNGPPFNSEDFRQFLDRKGIEHEKVFPYHPNSNPVETLMKSLGKAIKIANNKAIPLDVSSISQTG